MGVERSARIDAEVVTIGQFDRSEKWHGKVAVTLLDDGRVQIGNPTQSGFESITFALDDLREAVAEYPPDHLWHPSKQRIRDGEAPDA